MIIKYKVNEYGKSVTPCPHETTNEKGLIHVNSVACKFECPYFVRKIENSAIVCMREDDNE